MNRRLFFLSLSLVGAFVLLVGGLRWSNAAASHPISPSSAPQRVGAGSGFFYDSGQRLGNSDSWGVALGDLDGDDDLDAFVGNGLYAHNSQPQSNEVWLNDGRGRFTSNGQVFAPAFTGPVALADLDGDSDLDAMVVNYQLLQPGPQGGAQVWLNDGSGQFTDSGQLLNPNLADYLGLTLGDVDGDNDVDAFIPGFGNTPLWLNQGNGIFSNSSQTFASLWDPTLADIDNDGDLDLVTARTVWWNMGGVQGGTLGQFVNSGQPFGNADMIYVVTGDLDGDGDQDALLGPGGCADCSAQIWLNNGSGVFSNSGQNVGQSRVAAMALGDLDGDGDLDAYISQPFDQAWTDDEDSGVWLNDGNGILTDTYQSLGQGFSPSVALGDLNGDGTLDAFVGMYMEWDWINEQPTFEAPNQVWFNKPQADLALHQTAQVNGQTITYTLTYTNNGPDLVLGATMTDTLNPALSNITVSNSGAIITPVIGANLAWQVAPLPAGSGGVIQVRGTFAGEIPGNVAEFAAATQDPLPHNNVAMAYALTVDAAAPGHNSFPIPQTSPLAITFSRAILPSTITSHTLVVQGNQTGQYEGIVTVQGDEVIWNAAAPFKPGESLTVHVDQAMLSAGGSTNLLPYQQQFEAGVGLSQNIGTGILIPTHIYTTTQDFLNATLGDLDDDGDLDAFLVSDFNWDPVCQCYFSFGAQVWLNNGGLQGGVPGTYTDTGQTLGEKISYNAALGDVDNDGDLDAFIANWSIWNELEQRNDWNNGNELWLNDGTGHFTRSEQHLGYKNSYAIALGDVDGDHDLDALIANYPGSSYQFDGRNELWLNDGQGHFTHSGQILGDQGGVDARFGDLDGDGDLDAFIIFHEHSRVWLNQGGIQGGIIGDFVATSQDWSNMAIWSMDVGDLDGDGDLDILIGDGYLPGNQVWLNTGSGSFVPGAIVGNSVDDLMGLGDLDSDGDLDALIISTYGDPFNTVWLNDGTANFTPGHQITAFSGFVELGDVDNDGDLDRFSAFNTTIKVWLNQDDVTIAGLQAYNSSPTIIGQTTMFTSTVTSGTHIVYTWDFGDGQGATGATVNHIYANPGVYTATITASNSLGQLITTTQVTIRQLERKLFLPLILKPPTSN